MGVLNKMKLHLGCGPVIKQGFINIDILDVVHPDYVKHDLTKGLPPEVIVSSEPIDLVYSSHFLEHLSNSDAANLLNACYSAMSLGGVIKLCLPDIVTCIKEWINGNTDYFKHISRASFGIPSNLYSWISYLEFATHQSGEHLALWNEEKAFLYLKEAGFKNMKSRPPEDIDGTDAARLAYSFFVQAEK